MAATRRPRAPQVTVQTTPEIIALAVPAESGHCVYADAIKAAFPGARGVSVDLQTCRFTDPKRGLRYSYLTPRSVQVDLVNFDLGVLPEPKTIRLRGGHVTKANRRTPKPRLQAGALPKRKSMYRGTSGDVVDVVGGQTAPLAAYGNTRGHRREFGLRGLGRVQAAQQPVGGE